MLGDKRRNGLETAARYLAALDTTHPNPAREGRAFPTLRPPRRGRESSSERIDFRTSIILKGKIMDYTSITNFLVPHSVPPIVATAVDDEPSRMKCLRDIAGDNIKRMVALEHAFFDAMRLFDGSYGGGWWDFFQLSNGGFYVALKGDKQFHLRSPNGFECDVDANTAGLIISAFAFSHLSFGPNGEAFAEQYHLLSDFIFQHPEAGTIRAALD